MICDRNDLYEMRRNFCVLWHIGKDERKFKVLNSFIGLFLFLSSVLLDLACTSQNVDEATTAPATYTTYLYLPSASANTIKVLKMNESTGTITEVELFDYGTVSTMSGVYSAIATSTGNNLYVGHSTTSQGVSHLSIDTTTGALTYKNNYSTTSSGAPWVLAMDYSDNFLFAGQLGGSTTAVMPFLVSSTDSTLTGGTHTTWDSGTIYSVQGHRSGRILFVGVGATVESFTYDETTGDLTSVGSQNRSGNMLYVWDMTTTIDGTILVCAEKGGVSTFTIDQSTGALTELGYSAGIGGTNNGKAVEIHPAISNVLYVQDITLDTVATLSLDSSSGTVTEVGTSVSTGAYPSSIRVVGNGKYLVVLNKDDVSLSLYDVDSTTGALTLKTTYATADLNLPSGISQMESIRIQD